MIIPLNGYILLKQTGAETRTSSGLYLAEQSAEKPAEGEVLQLGGPIIENGREISSPVAIGDTVVFKRWGGDDIKDGSEELKLVKFEDLMAIKK